MDDHPRLNRTVRDRIDRESDVRVCAVSLLEIATAVSLNQLILRPSVRSWLEVAQTAEQIHVEPLTDALCIESVSFPGDFHRDPADRLIVALARLLDTELVTSDEKILAYSGVRTIPAS